MRIDTYKHSVFPADIILDLLNDNPQTDVDLLDYYNNYIQSVSTEPVYSSNGNKKGYFINEDLAQEIQIELLRCLPVLRKKLIAIMGNDMPLVFVISKDNISE